MILQKYNIKISDSEVDSFDIEYLHILYRIMLILMFNYISPKCNTSNNTLSTPIHIATQA